MVEGSLRFCSSRISPTRVPIIPKAGDREAKVLRIAISSSRRRSR